MQCDSPHDLGHKLERCIHSRGGDLGLTWSVGGLGSRLIMGIIG